MHEICINDKNDDVLELTGGNGLKENYDDTISFYIMFRINQFF